ncbi:hypothetical protein CWI38_1253p0010 [Hamiltosporidium tvaerminnensis]|uniref:WD40 domain-containing protein n=2 Tax=Hamiltosporidium TaxID=1176354 RepID=A0A4Q9L5X8_9MICR|nr:hypothetical protein LUQ84_000538 [Hamiltosporidium tvaerminnensis]TBU00913.1 hypothetical protein CWI37_0862p0020 [Hamiltosporidium tvaerminnensis]TBU03013.1 hypothetical protein CWI36_1003p0010 [Hamiltosporidium magnivora]TBU06604.1 hypothetical protein CWI39_0457p0010 [Hamiltosporidium magnivora]TBU11351.1 hypothetical protein CWI38_1253p0010 [Hamiltosporidium tvaerminnensis]
MINNIGFLDQNIEFDIKKYVPNKEIAKEYDYGPFTPDLDALTTENFEIDLSEIESIEKTDQLIYCTVNSEEQSGIQFNVLKEGEKEVFLHHDISVLNTVVDSEYMNINDQHYIVLASYDTKLEIYDCCTFNPLFPQFLLKGHESSITSCKSNKKNLYSGDEGGTIIKWDLSKFEIQEKIEGKKNITRMFLENDILLYSTEFHLSINNSFQNIDSIKFHNEIEYFIIKENFIYVSDSIGHFYFYDLRYIDQPVSKKRLHLNSLSCFDINRSDMLVTCGLDKKIKQFNLSSLNKVQTVNSDDMVFSVKFSPFNDNLCFYGGPENELSNLTLK